MIKNSLALGVDLGWVSQLESQGYGWVDDAGDAIDPILACKNMGANAVRLRLFVDPPQDAFWQKTEDVRCMLGLCDAENVLAVSKRVKDLGMDLMLDLHYSDHFADPELQDIPGAWANHDPDQLAEDVAGYTRQTLLRFCAQQIEPRWVQVGNEVNNGMMWPKARLSDSPGLLVRLLNAGYGAVKDVFPDCQVITHLSMIDNESLCVPFLDNFFARGGKTDLLGFSYYPFWSEIKSDAGQLAGWLAMYEQKYDRPVLIAEVGACDEDWETGRQTITDCMDALRRLPFGRGIGVFYWEPDAHRSIVPDGYPLGACVPAGAKRLRFTKALTAYAEVQK